MTDKSLPTTFRIPRCPACGSVYIQTVLASCAGIERVGNTSYFVNRTHESCSKCGHIWNRRAFRGVGITTDPSPNTRNLIARLWQSLTRLW